MIFLKIYLYYQQITHYFIYLLNCFNFLNKDKIIKINQNNQEKYQDNEDYYIIDEELSNIDDFDEKLIKHYNCHTCKRIINNELHVFSDKYFCTKRCRYYYSNNNLIK